jgi:hypothetical protein
VYIVMAIVVPEEGEYPMTKVPPSPGAAGEATSETQATTSLGTPPAYAVDPREARRAARDARRAERRANRGNTGPVLIGAFLIVLGAFFLVREWLPQIDFDWVWPAMLIVLGVAVLVASIRRVEGERRDEDRGSVG